MKFNLLLLLTFLYLLFPVNLIIPQGKVYLILGSDTAIWSGMDVSQYHCYYNLDLFTAANSNTSVVMSESFRNQLLDSYGNRLKMTWWMMAGNIFRYANNNNVPISNTMTLFLMKKYFGDKVEVFGDELSLHYHTFSWTDYDGDGKYWWNQADGFLETKDDFDFTLAQYLLEENVFPVSFRSGWHYMDNDWQNYLNDLLPYSLHNDWPAINDDITEPIDNDFDWSQSSSEFVPFHPATENYQLSGDGKGWNVRSDYMGAVIQEQMDQIFHKANQGVDQVVCFWSHLPDQNFLNEVQQLNNIAHQSANNYPSVKFKYCTGVEAYQLWLQSNDSLKPELQLAEEIIGAEVKFLINTNEQIFQRIPFVAVKDRYERYFKVDCENLSQNTSRTVSSFPLSEIAKVGVAVTDNVGNLTTSIINYLPDDKFIDNNDAQYHEVYGNWITSSSSAWNLDSRITNLNSGDSAKVRWDLEAEASGLYNLFVQFPDIPNQMDTIYFEFFKNGQIEDTIKFAMSDNHKKWLYVTTLTLESTENNFIEMAVKNNGRTIKIIAADALKLTAYIRDRQLTTNKQFFDLSEVSIEDTMKFNIEISNIGINNLTISSIYSSGGNIGTVSTFPEIISGMDRLIVPLIFIPKGIGNIEDTIIVNSNDPLNPVHKIPLTGNVENYFKITDNEDIGIYSESGTWSTSVAQGYGPSSRYAYIQSTPNGPTATFTFQLNKNGNYDIYEILPKTVNSANNALYIIIADGIIIDSVYLNQNEGSGSWKSIGRYFLPAQKPISIKVIDSGESSSGPVIRADAFKISLYEETTNISEDITLSIPKYYKLFQNFPNPFNPSTLINWRLPVGSNVTLKVFDVLGKEVAVLINDFKPAGNYKTEFIVGRDSRPDISSGVYFYQLKTIDFVETKKMLLLR